MRDIEKIFAGAASSWFFAPYFVIGCVVLVFAGMGSGNGILAMLVMAGVFGPFAFFSLRDNGHWITFLKLAFGLAILAVAVTAFASWWTMSASMSIPGATARMDDLNAWVALDEGGFADFGNYALYDILLFVLAAALSAATCGVGGVALAGREISITAFQAAVFYSRSKIPAATLFAAWAPWWVLRTAGLLFVSLAMAGPLIERVAPNEHTKKINVTFLAIGGACLAVDLILRYFLGDIWREILAKSIL